MVQDSAEAARADAVMGEFKELAVARHYFAQGGLRYAQEVLEATVGSVPSPCSVL